MNHLFISFEFTNITGNALVITIVGYIVVFLLLATMVIIFNQYHRIKDRLAESRRKEQGGAEVQKPAEPKISGDENAAICTALYLYFTELHDEEKYVMTVKKVSKSYSPWSSKIYGVMNPLK